MDRGDALRYRWGTERGSDFAHDRHLGEQDVDLRIGAVSRLMTVVEYEPAACRKLPRRS